MNETLTNLAMELYNQVDFFTSKENLWLVWWVILAYSILGAVAKKAGEVVADMQNGKALEPVIDAFHAGARCGVRKTWNWKNPQAVNDIVTITIALDRARQTKRAVRFV